MEGEGAGTGRSEAHQSPLVPASVLEADVAPTPPPSALPAPALEASGRSGTALLPPTQGVGPAAVTSGCPSAPPCAEQRALGSLPVRLAGHQGLPANHQKLGEGPGTRSPSQPWGHLHLPASRTRRPNMSALLSAPVCGTDGGSPVVGNTAST